MGKGHLRGYFRADKELVIVLLLVVITGLVHFFVDYQRVFLNFFYLPVLLGAYFFGKRHGTYSGILSFLMIMSIAYFIPENFLYAGKNSTLYKWTDLVMWGSFLVITGYAMGTLYDKKETTIKELKKTYDGIITMLSLVVDWVEKYAQSHSYRVSKYAEKLAVAAGLPEDEVEDIRIAALLHDLGKIGVSAEVLNKIGRLNEGERKAMSSHADKGSKILEPVGGRVLKILPLILNHHERYDGKGGHGLIGDSIPIGAKIIAVADVYDALTTDRPYRKALTPLEGKKEIVGNTGSHFDPEVVRCFESVFHSLEAEGPLI